MVECREAVYRDPATIKLPSTGNLRLLYPRSRYSLDNHSAYSTIGARNDNKKWRKTLKIAITRQVSLSINQC